jgi:hypothetical protein
MFPVAWFVGDDLLAGVSTPSGGFPSTYIRSTFSLEAKSLFSTSISGGATCTEKQLCFTKV